MVHPQPLSPKPKLFIANREFCANYVRGMSCLILLDTRAKSFFFLSGLGAAWRDHGKILLQMQVVYWAPKQN